MPLAITPTFSPWMHTSDDSYIYQLSLVLATATVSYTVSVQAKAVESSTCAITVIKCDSKNSMVVPLGRGHPVVVRVGRKGTMKGAHGHGTCAAFGDVWLTVFCYTQV